MPKIALYILITIFIIIGLYYLLSQKPQSLKNLDTTPSQLSIIPTQSMQKLEITDLVVGMGAEAKKGDIVEMNYVGTLENGTKFDSSYDRKLTFETQIGVGQVIKGWDEGVPGMKVGGKRKLIIPADMAYGSQGAGDVIPPNSTLIFEVELVSIK